MSGSAREGAFAPAKSATLPRRNLVLALSAASGSGKTTILRKLFEVEPDLAMSVSVTTRPPRSQERRGDHYVFVDREKFLEMLQQGIFLEHAEVHGYFYGTPRAPMEKHLDEGRDVLCDLDWQGARSLRKALGEDSVSVFMLPPSMKELRRRLLERRQDDEETIRKRLAKATDEISHWDEFDHVVVNHDRDNCVDEIRSVLLVERIRRRRSGIPELVARMLEEETDS